VISSEALRRTRGPAPGGAARTTRRRGASERATLVGGAARELACELARGVEARAGSAGRASWRPAAGASWWEAGKERKRDAQGYGFRFESI
jgi:hypothetical protein